MTKDTKIDEIVNELQKRINDGLYVAGQRLPAERDLAGELNVSRQTVRSALNRLQTDNLVDVVPRGGAFVRAPHARVLVGLAKPGKVKGPELNAGSFIRAMKAQGRETVVRFVEPSSIIPVGSDLGAKMETDDKTLVLRRYRVHVVDRIPYRVLESFYLASLLGELLGKDEGYIPLFKWLRDHTGKKPARAFERLDCRMPSAEEAALLNIARSQPVVDMDRWVWTEDSILFEYTHIVANAALHEYAYTYEIDDGASL